MKIEINLRDAAYEPDLARSLAVALLSALPQDAAELAIAEWRAVLAVRLADDAAQLEAASIAETLPLPPVAEELATADDVGRATIIPQPASLGTGTPLDQCGLSSKTFNPLKNAGFQNLGDLTVRSAKFLLGTVDRFGKGGLDELQAVLASAGLSLAPDDGAFVPQAPAKPHPVARTDLLEDGHGGYEDRHGGQVMPTDGSYAAMGLRELCRHAEHEIGRDKVWGIFQKHGVSKLAEITDETTFRADVVAALA